MKIADKPINEFLNDIASKPETPAGGCTAALCAASSAALVEMIARNTLKNKQRTEEVENYMENVIQISSNSRRKFLDYMDIDTKAYKDVINAQKNKKENLQKYYESSVNILLEIAREVYSIIDMIKEATKLGNTALVTDGVSAILMAKGTIDSLIYHIKFNLMYIEDEAFIEKVTEELQFVKEKIN